MKQKRKCVFFGFKKMIYHQIFMKLRFLTYSMKPREREEGSEEEGRKR
jgi:hypothetical protein